MSKGNSIILSANPQGKFDEGIINDTSKPGMFVEVVPATAPINGRFTYRARSITAGAKGPVAILMEDDLQGKLGVGALTSFTTTTGSTASTPGLPGDAFVAGTRCRIYYPVAGEELNALVTTQTGTADDVAIGDLFGIDATGGLTANNSYASAPFEALELIRDPTAAYMLWVKYLGNLA